MTTHLFRALCLVIGLFAAALPAQAFDWKPYAGAGAGDFIIDAGPGSKSAFGGYGLVGADFTDNIGAEVRFGTTGKTSTLIVPQGAPDNLVLPVATPGRISIDWFVAYLLKLQYPVSPLFRVYGVVGATTFKSSFAYVGHTGHATYTALSYGGGFDYGLGNQWRIGLDATVYSNKATTTPAGANFTGLDVWGITATAKYGF